MKQDAQRFDVTPSVSNHFAWLRTRIALERTFMAWIRTAVSLIGFGFTITQFFARLRDMGGHGVAPMGDKVPRDLGLTLIAAGVGALTIAAWQYHLGIAYLRSPPFSVIAIDSRSAARTPVFIAALILILIGVGAFIAVLFRFT
jgi:putative membrane protein